MCDKMFSRSEKIFSLLKKQGNTSNGSDRTICDGRDITSPMSSELNESQERIVTQMESEMLNSDFSDEDPTYVPDPKDLITLDDLLEPNVVESRMVPYEDIFDCDDVAETREVITEELFERIELFEPIPGPSNNTRIFFGDVHYIVGWILDEMMNSVWKSIKPLKRWRRANPENWARNVSKSRRNDGLSYTTGKKNRSAKVPRTINCDNCIFKCTEQFNEDYRNIFCRNYWSLDFKAKKNYILSLITIHAPKKTLIVKKRSQREFTKKCFFLKNNTMIQVCQNFFCGTLNIRPGIITDAIKRKDDTGFYPNDDQRGKKIPPNKTPIESFEFVKAHINTFPTMEPHYVRQNSQRKYLDQTLSITKMYSLYKEECLEQNLKPVSEITYRRIFCNNFNLSFFVPKKDQCLVCSKYNRADANDKKNMEANYKEHIERKEKSFLEKKKDKERANKDKHFCSLTFDLQAVLQIPSGLIGLLYYCRKLCAYNLCVYEAALPNTGYCFAWSEINGKRGSAEIGTILYHYLAKCLPSHVSEVCLYSDTCGGQNRNQFVSALLLWAVQKIDNLHIIEHKFLESGHSYMEADSMHSSIESAKKNASIYSMHDLIEIFKRARSKKTITIDGKKLERQPYNTKEFKFNEFFDLKALSENIITNRTRNSDGKQVQWLKIKRMKYVKGEPSKIYYNYDMSEIFFVINVQQNALDAPSTSTNLTTRISTRGSRKKTLVPSSSLSCNTAITTELKQLYQKPLPISLAKKKDLLNLCAKGVIPEEFHGWYSSFNTHNEADRVPEQDIGDESDESD